MGRARHEAHHFIKEARARKCHEGVVPFPPHVRTGNGALEVVFRDGARLVAPQGGKGRKVVFPQKEPGGFRQGVQAPGQRTVPDQARVKRVQDGFAGNAVAVRFPRGAEAGVKAGVRVLRMDDPDGAGQAGIDGRRPFVCGNAVGVRRIHVEDLPQGVHSGVRPAGPVDADGFPEKG